MDSQAKPQARQDGLVVQPVGEELVIYDRERQMAHQLNATAARIWENLDGQKDVAQVAAAVNGEDSPVNENLVQLGIAELGKANLLSTPGAPPGEPDALHRERVNRRKTLEALALLGSTAVLLPMVKSITAPTITQVVSGPQ